MASHEITALIRDTEPHERSLFSLDPSVGKNGGVNGSGAAISDRKSSGRKSIYANASPVRQSAVARVLGNDMLYEIRQSSGSASRVKGGVNIEVLLRGVEKLCEVYAVAGAPEKVASIRRRHEQFELSVSEYQDKVLKQQSKLTRARTGSGYGGEGLDNEHQAHEAAAVVTEQDFEMEQHEIKELEARKKELEERLASMESDLGGLLR